MSLADLRREQRRRLTERRRRRREALRQQRAEAGLKHEEIDDPPIPDFPTFLAEHFFSEHISNPDTPIAACTDLHSRVMADTGLGDLQAGFVAAIWAKARRQFASTFGRALSNWVVMKAPSRRSNMYLPTATSDIRGPADEAQAFAIANYPRAWRDRWQLYHGVWEYWHEGITRSRKGPRSHYGIITAGHSEGVASRKGRFTRIDFAHLCDAGYFQQWDSLLDAVYSCLPIELGWMLAEGTMSGDLAHGFTREFMKAWNGDPTRWTHHVFSAWHEEKTRRIPKDSRLYRQAHELELDDDDLKRELELELDDEQIAFRRWYRCQGDRLDRLKAKREHPEFPEETIEVSEEAWLSEVIAKLQAGIERPIVKHYLGGLICLLWAKEARQVVIGVDTAEWGRDRQAVVFLDADTGDQIAQVHGRGLPSDVAVGIAWVMLQLGIGELVEVDVYRWEHLRYTLVIERNRGRSVGGECERIGLKLWCEKGKRWGFLTSKQSRPHLIGAVSAVCVGPMVDDDGNPREPGPMIKVRSSVLVQELGGLRVDAAGRVAAGTGHHDDLVLAFAIALWVLKSVHTRKPLVERWTSNSDSSQTRTIGGVRPPV